MNSKSVMLAPIDEALSPISEKDAAAVMWEFYKANKASLISDIREYRDFILSELVRGRSSEQVFHQFTQGVAVAANLPAKSITISTENLGVPAVKNSSPATWMGTFAPRTKSKAAPSNRRESP